MVRLKQLDQLPVRSLLLGIASSFLLVACGSDGGNNKDPMDRIFTPPPVSSSSSSASSVDSSDSSSSDSSSSAGPVNITIGFADGIEGWFVNGDGTNLELSHDADTPALKVTPIAWTDSDNWKRQVRTSIGSDMALNGAKITIVVNVPQSYVTDAGLVFQPVLQDSDVGYKDAWVPVTGLTAGDNSIVLEPGDFTSKGETFLGLQLSNPPTNQSILDPLLIKSVEIEFPGGSSGSSSSSSSAASGDAINFNMSSGWRANGGGAIAVVEGGIELTATSGGQGAVYDINDPINFVGGTLEIVVRVSDAYKASGADVQPFAQEKSSWGGQWDCGVSNATLVTDSDMTLTCPLSLAALNAPAGGVQLGVQAPGSDGAPTPAGTILIKSAKVILAN